MKKAQILVISLLVLFTMLVSACSSNESINADKNGSSTVGSSDGSDSSDDKLSDDSSSSSDESESSGNVAQGTTNVTVQSSFVSKEELMKHNNVNDCWVVYEGIVYNITEFVPKHPGSAEAIIPYCGTSSEFEKAFTDKHGISKVQKLISVAENKGEFK